MGILGLSAHKSRGWEGQLDRVKRWHDRLIVVSADPTLTPQDRLDFLLAFCQNCYALRDWLEKGDVVSKPDLDRLMENTQSLRVCRDIANGSKHFTVSRPSVDAHFSIGRQYRGAGKPESWFVVAGRDFFDAMELARESLEAWRSFLREQGKAS